MPELALPHVRFFRSFVAAMAEFAAENRGAESDNSMIGRDLRSRTWQTKEGFAAYVAGLIAAREEETPRPDGFVPHTTFWWVDGYTYIGRLAIRHRLTPGLLEVGGHIGYDVRASRRREGHATAMLAAALPIAHELGIDPALITCDEDNIGSRAVIERAGGRYEDSRDGKRRYWVPTHLDHH